MFHPCYVSLAIAMAPTVEFREAVAYALSCIHQEDLILKPKQEEALIHLSMVEMSSLGFRLDMESPYVTSSYRSCSTSN